MDFIFYLDPDTFVFNDLKNIESQFESGSNVLLTPHILTPIEIDGKMPKENIFLKYGLFNLGFLGFKNPGLSINLLEWWKERTHQLGFNHPSDGLFVDQLWFNLVPIFFERIKISGHPGLNMAPWNLHERKLIGNNILMFQGHSFPLIFYHFSNFKYTDPDVLSINYDRYNFNSDEILKSFYKKYYDLLISNGIRKLSIIPCHYVELRIKHLEIEYRKSLKSSRILFIKHYLKKILPKVGIRILKAIKN